MESHARPASENYNISTLEMVTEQYTFSDTFTFALQDAQSNLFNPVEERILMTIYQLLILIPGSVLNGFVIYLTTKYEQFQNPYMYVRSATAAFDLAAIWTTLPLTIINDFVPNLPERLICYTSAIGVATFLSTAQFPAVVAIERYFFFCRPFLYPRYFTKKSIIAATLSVFVLTHFYSFLTEIIYERQVQSLVAFCQLVTQSYHTPLQIGIFFLPSMVATIFSVLKVAKLINRVEDSQVAQHTSHIANSEQRMRKRAAEKSLRLILLMSGAFWGTLIPCYLFRFAVFQIGYTWETLNAYESPAISVLYRYTHMSYVLSCLLNPIIYLYIYKDFRVAFIRVFRKAGTFSWEADNLKSITVSKSSK